MHSLLFYSIYTDVYKIYMTLIVGLPDTPSMQTWLLATLPPRSRVGIDPYLMDWSEFSSLSRSLESSGHKLVTIDKNIVDLAWTTRPELVLPEIVPLEFKFSGIYLYFAYLYMFVYL